MPKRVDKQAKDDGAGSSIGGSAAAAAAAAASPTVVKKQKTKSVVGSGGSSPGGGSPWGGSAASAAASVVTPDTKTALCVQITRLSNEGLAQERDLQKKDPPAVCCGRKSCATKFIKDEKWGDYTVEWKREKNKLWSEVDR